MERLSAVGRIPGTHKRREIGGEAEALIAATIERALRPLFPAGFETHSQVRSSSHLATAFAFNMLIQRVP